uniref:Uncharacterized protein n=1 Tax=Myotis myotis TaxID=51298 RepID=A0A7J7ZY88_MYOMY|nr:hypothetical protein mMyoMyo1_009608 [Myotis myotis]
MLSAVGGWGGGPPTRSGWPVVSGSRNIVPSLRPQFRSPPGGAHGSPTLALWGSSACDGGRSSQCPPWFSHLHSPGRLAGPALPRTCLAREARSSLPSRSHSSATASPTFRSAPELVSSPSSSRPGSQTGARAGCPSPGAPLPSSLPCESSVCQHQGLGPPGGSRCPRAEGPARGTVICTRCSLVHCEWQGAGEGTGRRPWP